MQFHHVPSDENYPLLKLASETGKYEVGLTPVLFGVRVRSGRAGFGTVDVDYCAGADVDFQMKLLLVIIKILERFPEDALSADICKVMPSYKIRPINNDPCWGKLQALAGETGPGIPFTLRASLPLPEHIQKLRAESQI